MTGKAQAHFGVCKTTVFVVQQGGDEAKLCLEGEA